MKYKNYIIFSILIIILLILIIILFINSQFKYTYFHKTGHFNKLLIDIFKKYNINKNNNNWNIYIPKGYTTAETQLINLKLPNKKVYIFAIRGCDKIVAKNNIWKLIVNRFGRNHAKTLMPETYVYDSENDMRLFNKDYRNSNIYILKKYSTKEGLKLTDDYYTIINSKYEKYKIIQKYLTNLYLINKRKVNLRIYYLIVIDNNNIKYYLSKLGKCIYTNKDYDKNNTHDLDFEKNITSYNLDLKIYNKNPKSLQDLKKYLGDKNGNLLFNNIDKLFKKVSDAIHPHIQNSPKMKNTLCFQHFGADVVFDNNFNPYLLEFNKGPDMSPKDNDDSIMKKQFILIFLINKIINKLFYNNF